MVHYSVLLPEQDAVECVRGCLPQLCQALDALVPNLILHLAMCAALASLVVREDHPLSVLLSRRPVVRLGEISYGIYLYHLIGLYLANVVLTRLGVTDLWIVTAVYLAASVALAEISDRTLERYFRRFRKPQVAKI